ncbi:FtsH protease activity modulator HflK [Ochrobactrum sp. MR28]|jgi:membrane protease subunit HflK|uniref:FtsH protease activity modulator HflK n=1 Tax=Pseudochrobactrum asaccharolyticum TaxID=354351 RepID=UPI002817209E|nr:FtsH protease activity modulator HflK [Ochrobactrum sp. MR28]MBX8814847.1 FtsH protease activity modulator HflK [Ochrobactrum sp. MR31]MDR2312627.1 FtsH protease activity modulator HflK [Brucellaceae bacterium]
MPWSNQNGGGPWGGGDKNGGSGNGGSNNGGSNQGGPWGQGPKGPRGGPGGSGGTPPDLEDILRKGQDRLKKVIPGGGGNGGGPAMFVIGAVALAGFWLFQAMYTVQPDELAVEMRFGVPKEVVSEPGLHFHLWPIETYEKVSTGERQINIGGQGTRGATQGLMLTGDQNIVNVQFSVLYRVSDPRSYLFKVQDPDNMVRQVSESAIREIVGRRPAQDVFRDNRAAIAESVRDIVQATLNGYGAGIQITALSIEDAAPPREVADAFDEVQRAEQDEDRFVEEANQYSNQKLGQARGEAAQVREDAAGYKTRMVQEAEGESQRFNSVLSIYKQSPDVTRDRLFIETMEQVLKDSNKVIIEGGNNVMPYLPLTELMRQQNKAGGSQ